MKLRDVNRPNESLTVLDSLGLREPGLLRWTPSIHHCLSKYDAEVTALDVEAARAPATANSFGMQQSYLQALAAQGKLQHIAHRLDEVVALPAEAGTTVAHLLIWPGWELDAHGHAKRALTYLPGRPIGARSEPLTISGSRRSRSIAWKRMHRLAAPRSSRCSPTRVSQQRQTISD